MTQSQKPFAYKAVDMLTAAKASYAAAVDAMRDAANESDDFATAAASYLEVIAYATISIAESLLVDLNHITSAPPKVDLEQAVSEALELVEQETAGVVPIEDHERLVPRGSPGLETDDTRPIRAVRNEEDEQR